MGVIVREERREVVEILLLPLRLRQFWSKGCNRQTAPTKFKSTSVN